MRTLAAEVDLAEKKAIEAALERNQGQLDKVAQELDVSSTTLMLEATGEPDKLDKFLEVLRPFGVKEQARTGAVFMSRGAKVLNQRPGSASDRKYLAE